MSLHSTFIATELQGKQDTLKFFFKGYFLTRYKFIFKYFKNAKEMELIFAEKRTV